MKSSFNAVLAVLLTFTLPHGASSAVPVSTGDERALTAATQALCHQEVAMLGESATHGDGHTEAFKVALVERLVNECGFDSVFFEASQYEFSKCSELRATLRVPGKLASLWGLHIHFPAGSPPPYALSRDAHLCRRRKRSRGCSERQRSPDLGQDCR